MVVLLPAPFGPRNPKISPDSTANEISFTAFTVPNDFERDLVSTEYNTLIDYLNYKLLSVHLIKNLKAFEINQNMKGLCQKCHSSNVEITIEKGIPICLKCGKNT
jgi:hypothetical protein